MNKYELTVLIHPDLEVDLERPLSVVRDIVTANDGKVVSEDNWGKKRLAYTIAKESFAVYVQLVCELPAQAVAKVDATLNITDSVLRHLLVKVDPKAEAAKAETAAKSDSTNTEEE